MAPVAGRSRAECHPRGACDPDAEADAPTVVRRVPFAPSRGSSRVGRWRVFSDIGGGSAALVVTLGWAPVGSSHDRRRISRDGCGSAHVAKALGGPSRLQGLAQALRHRIEHVKQRGPAGLGGRSSLAAPNPIKSNYKTSKSRRKSISEHMVLSPVARRPSTDVRAYAPTSFGAAPALPDPSTGSITAGHQPINPPNFNEHPGALAPP